MPHTSLPPFGATHGPRNASVVLIGEAWGEQEVIGRRPFLGASGHELARMLAQSGLGPPLPSKPWMDRRDLANYWADSGFLISNVFAMRPASDSNDLSVCCVSKKEVPSDYPHKPLSQGKYISPEFLSEVSRLHTELSAYPRNLIIPLGATALWATLGGGSINNLRGVLHRSPFGKCLPTFHPANILRNWSQRPIVIADFMKAQRESLFPEIRRPSRQILINPTLSEIGDWITRALKLGRPLACDIETANKQITQVGFALSPSDALVIPLLDRRNPDGSFWPTLQSESQVWLKIKEVLESPIVKVGQNFLYDLQYIVRMGIRPQNCISDTMLLHHALYPEMQKGLGFLASLYADAHAWKLMRHRTEELKRDE